MSLTPATTNLPTGPGNMVFNGVGGGAAGQPVLTTIYDLAPWYQMRKVFNRHSFAPTFRMLLKSFGSQFSRGVAANLTGHYEEDWDNALLKVGSIVTPAGAAGADMVIALHADSMFNPSITSGGSARKASFPQANQRIMLPGGVMAFIKSKNVTTDPHRLTIAPVSSSVNLDTYVAANDSYFIVDNAYGEATGLPQGELKRLYKYSNTFQIVKAAFATSGSALTTEFFPTFEQAGENIAMILKPQMMRRFETYVSNALLYGQTMNNISDTSGSQLGYDVTLAGSEGLLQFINSNGYNQTYTPGSYALSDFYAVTRAMEQERTGSRELVGWQGYDIYTEQEQVFQNLYNYSLLPKMIDGMLSRSGPNVPNDGWQPSKDDDFVAWLGFKAAHLGGYTILNKMLHEFNEPIGGGAAVYDYMKWSIYMPIGETVDQKTAQPVANFGYEWRELTGYKREAIFATIGGAGVAGANGYIPILYAANEYDYMKAGIVSEIAFHGACGNRVVTQRPA